jgi:hypothetical protein
VVDEILADRVVAVRQEGDLELRADTVGAGDQDRVGQAGGVQAEEAAERTDLGEDARRERGARKALDAAHRLVAGVDIHPGSFVVHSRLTADGNGRGGRREG